MTYNSQTTSRDQYLMHQHPNIAQLLSSVGTHISPPKGILEQSEAAKNSAINATIGMSYDSSGRINHLKSIHTSLNLPPEQVYPYSSSYGQIELRKLWQQKLAKESELKPTEISLPIVCNGLTHGISLIATMFLDPGDEVITSNPYWGNYKLIFEEIHGVKLKLFPTFKKDRFNIDGLMQKIRQSSRQKIVILLNSPNNPTGYHLTIDEANELAQAIKDFAKSTNKSILLVLDEAYKNFVYENNIVRGSLLRYFTDLGDNFLAIGIDGPTKELFAWGLRIGFVTFYYQYATQKLYSVLESKLATCIRGNISMTSTLSQTLILQALQSPQTQIQLEKKFAVLQKRYFEISKILSTKKYKKYFKVLPFNSGYFLCLQLVQSLPVDQIREILLEEFGVGIITINPDLIRIAYSSVSKKHIQPLVESIYKTCILLSKQSHAR